KMFVKLWILIVLMGGMLQMSGAQVRDCSNTCIWRARCNPYCKDLVWTVVDGMCRVFQNGCIFGSANCMRANQCLTRKQFGCNFNNLKNKTKIFILFKAMLRTNRDHCMAFCPRMCYRNRPVVCGSFPYTNSNGTTGIRDITFGTRCFLDLYACQNAQ
ncbi:hypothetical protein KR009_002090, partial [Drosophila setifemur]